MFRIATFWFCLIGIGAHAPGTWADESDHTDGHVEASAEAGHGAESGDGTHGGNAHGDAAHSAPNPLIVGPDLAIVTALVFLLLLAILSKFAWKPIVEALDQREQGIADNIAAAAQRHDDAKLLFADYESKLSGAADEVRELLEEARRDAEHTRTQIITEAKTAAQAEQDRAMREVRNATDGALKEIAEKSANLAVDLAGNIVGEKLSASDHSRLIQDALTRFPSQN